MKLQAPAAARNREPIREVLARVLPAHGLVLELASGSGEHTMYFAQCFPQLTWQPSDRDDAALASIEEWRAELALPNVLAPVRIDATDERWPLDHADAILCINMLHISPWQAALGLFAGAARVLSPGGLLYTYGPYRFDGEFTAPSNAEFDRSLRSRNAAWGVRDVSDLKAAAVGFALEDAISMPANNHSLIFRRV